MRHSGCPHVLLVSLLLIFVLWPFLSRTFLISLQYGDGKITDGKNVEVIREEKVWDIPWRSIMLDLVDGDHGMLILT
jgi:hypothetical protein